MADIDEVTKRQVMEAADIRSRHGEYVNIEAIRPYNGKEALRQLIDKLRRQVNTLEALYQSLPGVLTSDADAGF